MSRGYRIQDRTREKLAKLNEQVSKKKSRYRKQKNIELNDLVPTKKSGEFQSSKEVQTYIRQMEKFLSRKTQYVQNESGEILSGKMAQAYQREVKRVNKTIQKEVDRIANLETQIKGKQLGRTVGNMLEMTNRMRFPSLVPLTGSLNRFKNQAHFEEHMKVFKEGYFRGKFLKRKNSQYKQNFMDALSTVFGIRGEPLRKYISRMSINNFMDIYYATGGEIDIDYIYNDDVLKEKLIMLESTFSFTPSKRWQNLFKQMEEMGTL